MPRVTAKKSNLTKKPELEIEDSLRRLIKSSMEVNLRGKEFDKLDLTSSQKSEILGTVLDNFGEAVYLVVNSAVVNELSLFEDDEAGNEGTTSDYDRI